MKASELMSRDLYYVTPATSIEDVAAAMSEYALTCLPVVSRKRLVGIVSARDLALRGFAAGIERSAPISRIMSNAVVCCSCDDDLHQVCQTMMLHRVRRMPVVDKRGVPVGFLTLSDVAPELSAQALSSLQRRFHEEPSFIVAPSARAIRGPRDRGVSEVLPRTSSSRITGHAPDPRK